MAKDHTLDERQVDSAVRHSLHDDTDIEKSQAMHSEDFHGAAERGHVATDKYIESYYSSHRKGE